MRCCGVLLALSSLPSPYGIGTLGRAAFEFVDFLSAAGCGIWQMLPVGPTSYGDSPYQSFSSYAISPYYIDLETFIEEGLLTQEECSAIEWGRDGDTDYYKLYQNRTKLLKLAFGRDKRDISDFCKAHARWLDDYALFMALKTEFGGVSWQQWQEAPKLRDKTALNVLTRLCAEDIKYHKWTQFVIYGQWESLKRYANEKNVKLMGDVPIYVALDSADAWAGGDILQLDNDKRPTAVSGVPPDAFSATGQLWGNPVYDWDELKKTDFDWWVRRVQGAGELFDIVRVDHFRGFAGYYSIPYGSATAQTGEWLPGGGKPLVDALKRGCPDVKLVAEDLGVITPDVRALLNYSKAPGMKVLQFAFGGGSEYLPHNYTKKYVVYTGTHDNDTTRGWYEKLGRAEKKRVRDYIGVKTGKNIAHDLVRLALASVADTAVIPAQDILALGSDARMNTPSTLGGNWRWRLVKDQLTDRHSQWLLELNKTYQRVTK